MKIQSQDIQMQSQHIEYKSMLESELSFSSFIYDEPIEAQSQNKTIKSPSNDTYHTLNSIIERLFESLSQKLSSKYATEQNSDAVGYTHISLYEKYEEFESVSFSTKGFVKTQDKEIELNLEFSMSRSFVVQNKIDIYSEFDPLVINLDGDMPKLDTDTFKFDLDNDGEADQVSKLKEGSGFLALDKNNDGKINQGSELFGTITGDGFAELGEYDKDKNGWIDENDSIFNKLRVWLDNGDEDKELLALGEVGVGAIYLNHQESEFTYKTEQNRVLGELKSSGIFLNEDGSVGNISQIDFTSHTQQEPLAQLLQA
jgi:hypothetical protein